MKSSEKERFYDSPFYICDECFRSCYLNKLFCIFVYTSVVSTIDLMGPDNNHLIRHIQASSIHFTWCCPWKGPKWPGNL